MKGRATSKFDADLDFCKWLYLTANAMVTTSDDTIPFYEWSGHESWKAYVEKEVGITVGHARKYVRVHQTFIIDLKGVFDKRKHAIHLNKLIALAPMVDEDNLEQYIEEAKEMTAAEFRALTVEGWDLTHKNVGYSFPRNQDKVRMRAFKAARKLFGEDMTDSEVFLKICRDWYTKRDD
jgi:hypothetical protein